MIARHPIAECLISSRNILLGGYSNEHVLACLEDVLMELDSISILSTKMIIEYCVSEVIKQVKDSNFVSAGMILNFIHNLPLDDTSERNWDVDYFLSVELSAFLDNFDEVTSSRKIVLFICSRLAPRYLQND